MQKCHHTWMLKTEPRMKWCGEGETEPTENGKLVSVIMTNCCHVVKTCHTVKFRITDPLPPKFGFLLFWVSMEKWPLHFGIIEQISNYWPVQSLGLHFSVKKKKKRKGKLVPAIMKRWPPHNWNSSIPRESPMCSFTLPDNSTFHWQIGLQIGFIPENIHRLSNFWIMSTP